MDVHPASPRPECGVPGARTQRAWCAMPIERRSTTQPASCGERWIVQTVAMILENPRYTGRQVWNRHSTAGHGGGRRSGRGSGSLRPNPAGEWEVSEDSLMFRWSTTPPFWPSEARRPAKDGHTRRYQLAGLVVCGVCGRRMDAHWTYGRAAYRCRHGYTSATPRPAGAPALANVADGLIGVCIPSCGQVVPGDRFGRSERDADVRGRAPGRTRTRRGTCEARRRYLVWGVPVCDTTRTSDEAGRRATRRPVRRRPTGRW
jgi:hypothetical protein